MLRNFFLLSVSVLVALAGAELFLRWHPPLMVYMNTRNIVQQTHSEPSSNPILGYIPRANHSAPFSNREFRTRVTINSKNMRDKEYSIEKKSGLVRIAAAGDSFVFGWGVEDHEIFTEILEGRYLRSAEVLNFGVSGYDARQTLERIRQDVIPFNPDIVLFFLYGFPDGVPAQKIEFRNGILYWHAPERLSWIGRCKIYALRHLYLYTVLLEAWSHIRSFILSPKIIASSEDTYFEPEYIKAGFEIVSDFKELAMKHRFKPVLIYIPNTWNILDPQTLDMDRPGIQKLTDFSASQEIPFWDLTPHLTEAWKATGTLPYFRFDDHWNRFGHETAARVIADKLMREQVLSEEMFRSSSE